MMDEKNGNGEKKIGDPSIDVGGGRIILITVLQGFMLQNFEDVSDLKLAYLVRLIKLYENSNLIINCNCRFIALEARKQ